MLIEPIQNIITNSTCVWWKTDRKTSGTQIPEPDAIGSGESRQTGSRFMRLYKSLDFLTNRFSLMKLMILETLNPSMHVVSQTPAGVYSHESSQTRQNGHYQAGTATARYGKGTGGVAVQSAAAKRRERDTVTISRQEYEGLKETIDLLSRPANARRLRSALAQAKAGKLKERDL